MERFVIIGAGAAGISAARVLPTALNPRQPTARPNRSVVLICAGKPFDLYISLISMFIPNMVLNSFLL